MECPLCHQQLRISNTTFPVIDNKPYARQELVCINKNCTNYCGEDLNNPVKIVQTVENPL
jgi:hypothetical protein